MGLQLNWDNTALLANPNVLVVRALQRQKVIGGTFYTTGFIPANDLAPSLTSTEFTAYVVNKIYELKVQSICSSGGPTDNSNGIQEGIVFDCLPMVIDVPSDPSTEFDGYVDLGTTDIEGIKYTLKKQSDSSIVEPETDSPAIDGASGISYTGLDPDTDYYIDGVFYATINGVEVLYPCGGNVSGWQFTTDPAP
jgi:hypothetical protein